MIKQRREKRLGYVARMEEVTNIGKILVENLKGRDCLGDKNVTRVKERN